MPTRFWEAGAGRQFIGRLATDTDLVQEVERFASEHGIAAAWVSVVGAVRRATYAYYDQSERRYRELVSDAHHEISGFQGNLSLREGSPFLHAHATFADETGATRGGHLVPGCVVWVAEVRIGEFTDVALVREHDEVTGLALW